MPPPSDPRNLRAKWQRALEERRKAGAGGPPIDVTPGKPPPAKPAVEAAREPAIPDHEALPAKPRGETPREQKAEQKAEPKAEQRAESKAEPKAEPKTEAKPKEDDDAKKKASPGGSSVWSSVAAALILVGGVGFALRTFLGPDDASGEDDTSSTSLTTAKMEPDLLPEPARPQPKAHCTGPSKQAFVVGDAPAPKPAGTTADPDDPPEDDLAPFAVEIGRGVPFGSGFAVGTQRQAEGGTVSMVATIGENGDDGKLVRLARSRGDFDAPVVAAAGSSILAAMMEPNAGGRAIRIAKIEGDRVTWGPELSEGRDESLAVDLAATGARAIVVWDDVPQGRERSVIDLATFDVATLHGSGGRAITPPTIDADQPRLAPRPGGYWLSYMVHGDAPTEPTAAKNDDAAFADPVEADPKAKKPKDKPHKKPDNNDDSDTEAAGEAIAHTWIELVPLDESGMSTGAARAITPKDGRVIGYDLEDGADGSAVILYREDDTPNGSNGGQVKAIVVELGGVGEPRVIAEEGVGAGVPQLFGSWVAIHSLSGPVQIGALGPKGDVASEIAAEKSLGHGEVIAASNSAFLIGTPAGRAMKLAIARCSR